MKTQPADFLSSMKENIQNRRGATGAFMADQFEKYQWGVKLPHLMAEYLFGLNVIPMPSLIELAGKTAGITLLLFVDFAFFILALIRSYFN